MYPLHRGWLDGDENGGVVVITVGVGEESRQFSGRRTLLAHHSGYIKSLLDNMQRNHISVPSISPHVFATILNFINTGFLDLNPDNIYSVLLATHLLHMPRAVEICRSYLLGDRFGNPSPTLVKPIPSRKYLPATLYWPPPPPPTYFPAPIPPYVPFTVPANDPLPSTSVQQPPSSLQEPQEERSLSRNSPTSDTISVKSTKSVLKDIACCDGPVRFKRVLNVNYGLFPNKDGSPMEGDKGQTQAENKRLFICGFCKHTFKSHYCYRKHTRRHLNPVSLAHANSPGKVIKDMNVQYYPCKTCGSKFPSYYFVHKHRKLCHANEPLIPSSNCQNEESAE